MKWRNIVSVAAIICAAALCWKGKDGWGWFLLLGFLAYES